MTCRVLDLEDVIPKYLNGQLDPAAQDDFEVHILECPDCRDAVNVFQSVREQLEVRAHEIRSYRVGRNSSLWWSLTAVAACCVIAVAIGFRQLGAPPKPQTSHQQISTPGAVSGPQGQTAAANSSSSPSVLAEQQPAGNGSGNPPTIPENARGGVSAFSNNSDSADMRMQTPDHSPARSRGRAGSATQLGSANKELMSTTASGVSPSRTPDQDNVATAASPGNSTPGRDATADPGVAATTNPASPSKPVDDEIAQLAAVRPLPYSFSGLAASQPKAGGSTRGSHSSTSAVSGTAGSPQPGTGAFSTAQDYFRDGMTAYVEHRYESATDLLGQAVRMDPQFGEANLYLGICSLLQGNATDAVSPLQSASREKKPTTTQAAHFYLAKAFLKLGRLTDAEAELRAAAAIPGRLTGEANALVQRLQAIQHPDINQ